MNTYTFEVCFGYGPKTTGSADFDLELDEKEIAFLKDFLMKNGIECDYGYIEDDDPSLFNKINDAANDAVVKEINKHRRKKLDFFDIDWTEMSFDFYWPPELTE